MQSEDFFQAEILLWSGVKAVYSSLNLIHFHMNTLIFPWKILISVLLLLSLLETPVSLATDYSKYPRIVAGRQPRSQSPSAISDVTSPVKLVGKIRWLEFKLWCLFSSISLYLAFQSQEFLQFLLAMDITFQHLLLNYQSIYLQSLAPGHPHLSNYVFQLVSSFWSLNLCSSFKLIVPFTESRSFKAPHMTRDLSASFLLSFKAFCSNFIFFYADMSIFQRSSTCGAKRCAWAEPHS